MRRERIFIVKQSYVIDMQLYIYDNKSLYPAFQRYLAALCGEGGEWSMKGLSKAGVKDIKKRKSIADIFGKIPTTFPNGVNELRIMGSGSSELMVKNMLEVAIDYAPSPLNEDWAKFGEIQFEEYTGPIRRALRGLESRESSVTLKNIQRHPGFLSIIVTAAVEPQSLTRKFIIQLFQNMIRTISTDYTDGYIGYIDLSRTMPAAEVMGNVGFARGLDKFLDKPHAMVFAPQALLQRYEMDVRAAYPKLDILSEKIGSAMIVAFKDREELAEILMPEWHLVHPLRWKKDAVK